MVGHRATISIPFSIGVENLVKTLLIFVVSVITQNSPRTEKKDLGMSEEQILLWSVFYTLEIRLWKIFKTVAKFCPDKCPFCLNLGKLNRGKVP